MEAEVLYLYPGAYKNFDELEEYLTREELVKMYEKAHEIQKDEKRFAAALKGIDLEENDNTEFEDVKRRAEAKALGITEEQYELSGMIQIIDEDEGDELE